jgi:hypothetical protein
MTSTMGTVMINEISLLALTAILTMLIVYHVWIQELEQKTRKLHYLVKELRKIIIENNMHPMDYTYGNTATTSLKEQLDEGDSLDYDDEAWDQIETIKRATSQVESRA